MAEFPGFGRHCSFSECHLLDFLPVRCDACSKDFCASHFSYDAHHCESSYRKDVQVPVCPLCGKLVPVPKGQLPDVVVGNHIDADCKSDPALASRGKIYTNRCSQKGCKKRELVPMVCKDCDQNFCIKHRFPADHDCLRPLGSDRNKISPSAAAALRRLKQTSASSSNQDFAAVIRTNSKQSTADVLSDDEALARALQASLSDGNSPHMTPEEIDRSLAEELQREEYQRQQRAQRVPEGSSKDKCCVS